MTGEVQVPFNCAGGQALWFYFEPKTSTRSALFFFDVGSKRKKQLKFETGADQRWNRTGARIPGSQGVGPSINKKPSLLTLNWLVNRNIYVTLWCSLRKAKWQPTRSRRAANSEPLTKGRGAPTEIGKKKKKIRIQLKVLRLVGGGCGKGFSHYGVANPTNEIDKAAEEEEVENIREVEEI